MARNFFSLAAPNPGNQQIDFSAPMNALEGLRQQNNLQGQIKRQQEEQTYQRGRDQMQDQRVARADKMSLEESLAKRAAAIGMLPIEQRGPAWKQHVSTHLKYFPDNQLDPEDLSPETGPQRYAAAFGGIARDPREDKLMDLKLAQAQKSLAAPVGGDAPANVQEWQYYSKLGPEERQQYLAMKRAQQNLDLGDRFAVTNPAQPGQVAAEIPKNLVTSEAQKKLGAAIGEQAASAPGDLSAADTALDIVDSIRNDPNRAAGTGTLSPVGNLIPKTPGYAFETKVQQAKSGAFLTAIQQLRGMGALSNAEGQTATAAVTRMTTATRDEDFEEALQDYEKLVLRGRRSAERIMKERAKLLGQQPQEAADPKAALKQKYGVDLE